MKKKGFTLIELLVVIAIIGLLSTLAVVALNSARQKARDAKRVADIKQVQTALELYYNDVNSYPLSITGNQLILGGSAAKCLGTAGFDATCTGNAYMGLVPSNPQPSGADYIYGAETSLNGECATAGDVCATYSITFSLEGQTGALTSGARTATQDGIK
ncbi:MAG: prepilin-type N-terminal cleavage/methylation domain-containing protein [Patescibacteria group bacterium]